MVMVRSSTGPTALSPMEMVMHEVSVASAKRLNVINVRFIVVWF
jgi:hypothetical protein